MNKKLKIVLRCTKYLLVAVLVALPFIGPERTEAKAEEGYTLGHVLDERCPSYILALCYDLPGQCQSEGIIGCEYRDP